MTLKFIEPMECLPVPEIPEGHQWTYELKLDGYRLEAIKSKGKVTFFCRRGNDLTKRFDYIADALQSLPDETVIDGELVAMDEQGKPSFSLLQNFRSAASHIAYYAFDIMVHQGKSVIDLPLVKRRAVLAKAVKPSDHVGLSLVSDKTAVQMLQFVRSHGLEGIIAKRSDSVYQPGKRSGLWTKTRINLGQDFVIGGYIPSHLGLDSIVAASIRARISITQRECGQALCLPRDGRFSGQSST